MCWVGWTPLCRNSTYGLCVAKSPSSLVDFCSPFYFLGNHCCFACVSFHTFVLPFSPVLPILSCTSPKILLCIFTPAYFPTFLYFFLICTSLPFCISFSHTFLCSCTSHVCPALHLPKYCWACLLQHTSSPFSFPFPSVLPCIVDFERKSPQGFSNYYPVFLYCILV